MGKKKNKKKDAAKKEELKKKKDAKANKKLSKKARKEAKAMGEEHIDDLVKQFQVLDNKSLNNFRRGEQKCTMASISHPFLLQDRVFRHHHNQPKK